MNDTLPKIITLDTNILVRLFVADDERQYKLAVNLLRQVEKFIVPTTVFVETVWVLMQKYELSRSEIFVGLQDFIEHSDKLICQHDEVKAGLDMLNANGDFADGINAFLGKQKGGQVFVTFDRKAVNKLTVLGHHALLLK